MTEPSNDSIITRNGFRLIIGIVMIAIAVIMIDIRFPELKISDLAPAHINITTFLTVIFVVTYLLSGMVIVVYSLTTLFKRLKVRPVPGGKS